MRNITSSCMEMRSGQGQSFEGRPVFNNNSSNKQLARTPEWTSLFILCKQMSTLPRAVQTDSELCPLLFCVSFYSLPCIRLALNSSLQHFSLKAIHPPIPHCLCPRCVSSWKMLAFSFLCNPLLFCKSQQYHLFCRCFPGSMLFIPPNVCNLLDFVPTT